MAKGKEKAPLYVRLEASKRFGGMRPVLQNGVVMSPVEVPVFVGHPQ